MGADALPPHQCSLNAIAIEINPLDIKHVTVRQTQTRKVYLVMGINKAIPTKIHTV